MLHHTGDARKGFEALLRKVKPGGYIMVGLYNSYARLTDLMAPLARSSALARRYISLIGVWLLIG